MKENTIKEYLLSQGINSKQEKFTRKLIIDDETFFISIENPLKSNLGDLPINSKQIFALTYKCLHIIKFKNSLNIIYTPKNLVFNVKINKTTILTKSIFEISIFDSFEFDTCYDDFKDISNIFIVDTLYDVDVEKL